MISTSSRKNQRLANVFPNVFQKNTARLPTSSRKTQHIQHVWHVLGNTATDDAVITFLATSLEKLPSFLPQGASAPSMLAGPPAVGPLAGSPDVNETTFLMGPKGTGAYAKPAANGHGMEIATRPCTVPNKKGLPILGCGDVARAAPLIPALAAAAMAAASMTTTPASHQQPVTSAAFVAHSQANNLCCVKPTASTHLYCQYLLQWSTSAVKHLCR